MVNNFARRYAALLLAAIALTSSVGAAAVSSADRTEPVPKRLQGVDVREHLGERVPSMLAFKDESGKPVTLETYLHGGVPVIVTFNYSNCPMLCNLQLTGLVNGFRTLGFSVGKEFRVVTIILDPNETPETAHRFKTRYLGRYGRAGSESGWHFLTGSEANIRALANAAGFSYNYNEARGEYAHPAAITLLGSDGRIMRYLYGIEFAEKTLRLGVVEASQGRIGSSLDRLVLYCFHYDSSEGRYAPVAARIMQVAGGLTVLLLGGLLGILIWRDKKRALIESTAQ